MLNVIIRKYDWPMNLFIELFGTSIKPPEDFEPSLNIVLDRYLSADQKAAIIYSFAQKKHRAEIAEVMGITIKRASVLKNEALDIMRYHVVPNNIIRYGISKERKKINTNPLDLEIDYLDLSPRPRNMLKYINSYGMIRTIGDLVANYSEERLLNIRNMGEKSIEEIKEKLNIFGLALK